MMKKAKKKMRESEKGIRRVEHEDGSKCIEVQMIKMGRCFGEGEMGEVGGGMMKDRSHPKKQRSKRKRKRGRTYAATTPFPFFPFNNLFGILKLDIPNSAAIPSSRSPR